MNECLLCKRDMKVSNDVFGNSCIKTLITSFSFIFNMGKNKSQNEKVR